MKSGLFRYLFIVLLLLFCSMQDMWGFGDLNYKIVVKAHVSPSGKGLVYLKSDNEDKPSPDVWKSDVQTLEVTGSISALYYRSLSRSISVYAKVDDNIPGYEFSGWATSEGQSSGLTPGGSTDNELAVAFTFSDSYSYSGGVYVFNKERWAVFSPIDYAITYNADGGSLSPSGGSQTYNIESNGTVRTASKPGYTFNGWKVTSTGGNWPAVNGMVSAGTSLTGKYGNVTLQAQWTIVDYEITYDTDGGTLSPSGSPQDYNIESNGTVKTASKVGYTFDGWKVTSTGGNWPAVNGSVSAGTSLTGKYGNVTLTAQWTPTEYTITYNADGGTLSSAGDQTYNIESTSTVKTATKTDYTLKGWEVTATGGNWPAVGSTVSDGASLTGKYGNVALKALWGPSKADLTIKIKGLAKGETIMLKIEKDNVTLYTVPITGGDSEYSSVTIKDLPTGENYKVSPVQGWNFAYDDVNFVDSFGLGSSTTCSYTISKKTSVKKYDEKSEVNWKL